MSLKFFYSTDLRPDLRRLKR